MQKLAGTVVVKKFTWLKSFLFHCKKMCTKEFKQKDMASLQLVSLHGKYQ